MSNHILLFHAKMIHNQVLCLKMNIRWLLSDQYQSFVVQSGRVRLLLSKGHSCYRPRRSGERKRKSVRGCIVDSNLSVLALVIVKKGESVRTQFNVKCTTMSVKCSKTTGLLRKVEHPYNNLEIIFLLNPLTKNVFFSCFNVFIHSI